MVYTGAQVDSMLVQFESCAERQNAVKGSQVKLVAAERDLLKVAEKVRDLLDMAVKGDKQHLADVFGGAGLQRFHRFRNAMDTVELSAMHAGDQRWGHLKDAMDMVEEILKQLGHFKPFMLHGPPETIVYKGVPSKFMAGDTVSLVPEVDGGEPSSFTVEPALPEGLSISLIGEISGEIPEDTPPRDLECTVTASNGAGSTTTSIKFCIRPPAPKTVAYPELGDVFAGEAVLLEPTVTGGAAASFSVEPDLPKGMQLDASSGVIKGTPVTATPKQDYVVTAANDSGSATTKLSFGIMPAPPVSIKYPTLRPEYSHGVVMHLLPEVQLKGKEKEKKPASGWKRAKELVMKKDVPNLASQVLTLVMDLNFTISPDLPPGLSLIKKTGVITGTPSEAVPETTYKVTVKNDGGEVSTDLTFGIKLKPPSSLQYPGSGGVVYTGVPFSLSPEVEGVVQEWSIEPALPQGLVFDASMGHISGIPTEETAADASWTVTAKNSEGETSSTLKFEVKRVAPSKLEYPNLVAAYPVRHAVEGLHCTYSGEVDEFTVSPALPSGLTLNPSTGAITGTPTEVTEEKSYDIVAKNGTGSTTASVKFAVKMIGPEHLEYPQIDDVYNVGEDVNLVPTVEGGASAWQIEPALPEGMSFDTATGVISGAPTTTSQEKEYTVTASNEAGGTSAVLTFKVTAPKPEGLSYPAAGDSYQVGQEVKLEPQVASGICATYSVSPALPAGLAVDAKTGLISGTPEAVADKQAYTVTATNIAGSTSTELNFEVKEAPKPATEDAKDVDEAFATELEEVTDVANMPPKPRKRVNWMLWMVHRAWLNDPTLVDFVFTNMKMPLPHVEPRIAPKLMKALEHNTYITNLELANSNLQKPQGPQLAEALAKNSTLKILNVDSNNLDSDAVISIANSLKANEGSALEQLRLNNQKTLGENMGRSVEEAIASMLDTNQKIVKIGAPIVDPNWRYKIDKAILRNNDAARRRRKAGAEANTVQEKNFTKVTLSNAPAEKAAWEIFPSDDERLRCTCLAVSEAKQLPTRERFQAFSKGKGVAVPYGQIAPLLKTFSTKLLSALVGTSLSVTDDKDTSIPGKLRGFSEKNDRWTLDVQSDAGARYSFTATKQPALEVSASFADWLRPSDGEAA